MESMSVLTETESPNFWWQNQNQTQTQFELLPQQPPKQKPNNNNSLFVGDLSYFCDEHDLYKLFNEYFTVFKVQIQRSADGCRSLLYGFVTLANPLQVQTARSFFNGQLFMGRKLRIEFGERMQRRYSIYNDFKRPKIHVAIYSNQSATTDTCIEPIKPTEAILLKFFLRFGPVSDLFVNNYVYNHISARHDGYAFLLFEKEESHYTLLARSSYQIDGFTLVCTPSTRKLLF